MSIICWLGGQEQRPLELLQALRSIPPERTMIETGAPYFTPPRRQ